MFFLNYRIMKNILETVVSCPNIVIHQTRGPCRQAICYLSRISDCEHDLSEVHPFYGFPSTFKNGNLSLQDRRTTNKQYNKRQCIDLTEFSQNILNTKSAGLQ
jgi:hypothetical protein